MESEIKNQEETSKLSQEPEQQQSYAPEFDAWVKEKPRGNFIKPGEPKVIRFKSGKPNEMLMSDFGGKIAEKKPAARYLVTTPDKPNEEKQFDVTSKKLGRDIQFWVGAKGFHELEITRTSDNKNPYRVAPNVPYQTTMGH